MVKKVTFHLPVYYLTIFNVSACQFILTRFYPVNILSYSMKNRIIVVIIALAAGLCQVGAINPEQVLSKMTPCEKAGQMIIVYNPDLEYLKKYPVGGVILFKGMVRDTAAVARDLKAKQQAMKIPLLVCIDQEGGNINRLGNLGKYKKTLSAKQLAEVADDSVQAIAEELTKSLNNMGINTNFAPCLDPAINADGDTTFMEVRHRSFGEDVLLISRKGKAFARGINEQDGFSILKHFPGYDATGNSDLNLTESGASEAAMERFMQPFRHVIRQSNGLMMSNIIYRNLDSLPAVLSHKVVATAREICGDKLIITDDLWAVSVRQVVAPDLKEFKKDIPDKQFGRLVEMAVTAGNDMLLITHMGKVKVMMDAITRLINRDAKAKGKVDAAVLRILKLKQPLAP